jgi:L-iditol 2-dehydrogenase
MKTMKAMMLTGIHEMEMAEVPMPQIKSDKDVLIKMTCIGVCGSDVHYYTTGKIGSQVVEYPYAVGHEGAGIVEAIGSGVTNVKVGDRIAIEPAISCWECDQCKAGRHHTCRKLLFLGCPGQIPGCLSEYIVMPQESCFKIKDSMTDEEAAISEPLAIGVYAVKQSIPMSGAKIGILGAGPIGLSVLLPALAQGANKIYVTDPIEARLKLASELGASWTGNPEKADIEQAIIAQEPGLLDCVFECCGQQSAVDNAMKLLKPGGKLMMIGIPEVDDLSFHMDDMRRKELCVQNVRRQCDCVQSALDMIDDKLFDVNTMITHHFSFEESKAAFDLVDSYKDGVVKAMIHFS